MVKVKMKREYDQIVKLICGEDWSFQDKSQDEKDGGVGVAMVLAYLRGTPSRLTDLSEETGIPTFLLETAYKRLQINGVFSPRSWVVREKSLRTGTSKKAMIDWCHIAGLSS